MYNGKVSINSIGFDKYVSCNIILTCYGNNIINIHVFYTCSIVIADCEQEHSVTMKHYGGNNTEMYIGTQNLVCVKETLHKTQTKEEKLKVMEQNIKRMIKEFVSV